jgi:competence protein ComGC
MNCSKQIAIVLLIVAAMMLIHIQDMKRKEEIAKKTCRYNTIKELVESNTSNTSLTPLSTPGQRACAQLFVGSDREGGDLAPTEV